MNRLPELGPHIVFFTGGTALAQISRELARHTHNSVHLVTPFDSGGSSASLRRIFAIPAVGDVRKRLIALADTRFTPPAVLELCEQRLPSVGGREELLHSLYGLASARAPAWQAIPRVFGEVLRVHLQYFLEGMPPHFDPRGACLGNLVLAGGWLHNKGDLLSCIGVFSRLLQVRGIVLPVVQENLHLAAELNNGELVLGQHRITSRSKPLSAPVKRLFLTSQMDAGVQNQFRECRVPLTALAATYIRAADLICYPMGSFYTSVLANLLPGGVGKAIAQAHCPKLYIANSGFDPEQRGQSVADRVAMLLTTLRRDTDESLETDKLLNRVLIDSQNGVYPGGIDQDSIAALGLELCDLPLVQAADPQTHRPELVSSALIQAATSWHGSTAS